MARRLQVRVLGAFALILAILPHLITMPLLADDLKSLDERLTELHRTGRYREAIPLAEQSVALTKSQYGEDHPTYATAITWLARLRREEGRHLDAQALFERALAIDEKAFGPEHPSVGRDLNNLGLVLAMRGHYAEAEPLYRRAIAIAEKLGPEHPDVGARLNNLAALFWAQRRYSEAEPLFDRALNIMVNLTAHNDIVNQASSLLNMAAVLLSSDRTTEAQWPLRRALAIYEKVSGPDDEATTITLDWLSRLYVDSGRYAEAEPLSKRWLASLEKRRGSEHQLVTRPLNNLASVYWAQGRLADAEALYRRSLGINEKALGLEHPDVGRDLNNLALVLAKQGRYEEAEPLIKRALAITEKAVGPEHPHVGAIVNNLATLFEYNGRAVDAEPLYRRALRIFDTALGKGHPDVASVHENLGGLYKLLGRRDEAELLLESALAIKEKVFGAEHPILAPSLGQLADLYRLQGKCNQAEPLFLRARAVGLGKIQEVPVFFGTSRKRDRKQPSVTFSSERGIALSFGLAIVTVPNDPTPTPIVLKSGGVLLNDVAFKTTEVRRLAMYCMEVVNDSQVVEAAVRRLSISRTYPNQVVVFVHGYNVSFENAVRRLAQIAYDIKFDGGVFLFSWPSRERFGSYLSDRDTVDFAADHLRQFVEQIVARTSADKIHFVAHSMGSMVLLRTIESIAREVSPLRSMIGEIIHAAPDVDPDLFALLAGKIDVGRPNLTLYASRSDWPLWFSTKMRDRPRAGFIKDQPLIVAGLDTIDITNAGSGGWLNLFALNHDIYSSSPIIIRDIQRIIERGKRPPDKRTEEFEPVVLERGTYWRLRSP